MHPSHLYALSYSLFLALQVFALFLFLRLLKPEPKVRPPIHVTLNPTLPLLKGKVTKPKPLASKHTKYPTKASRNTAILRIIHRPTNH